MDRPERSPGKSPGKSHDRSPKRSYDAFAGRLSDWGRDRPGAVSEIGRIQGGGRTYPVFCARIDAPEAAPGGDVPSVFISAGIHGDEPAGAWAALEFLHRYPRLPELYRAYSFTVLPCTNPFGFENDTRENADGLDLNRQFRDSHPPDEVRLIKSVVGGRAYDLTLEFHEDVDSPGFYLYELTQEGEPSWGREIIEAVGRNHPVNRASEIEGTTAQEGLIQRSDGDSTFRRFVESRADWPQAFYHFTNGTRRSYTTESPVGLSRKDRTEIHLTCLDVAITKRWEDSAAPRR